MRNYKVSREWARLRKQYEKEQARAIPSLLIDYKPVEQGPKLVDWVEGACLTVMGVVIIIGLMVM